MPQYDLPLPQLREYITSTPEPPGLDEWWAQRLAKARAAAQPATLSRHRPDADGPLPVYDVEFSGDSGDRIRAWYLLPPGGGDLELPAGDGPFPAGAGDGPLPVVVKFIGYEIGRAHV